MNFRQHAHQLAREHRIELLERYDLPPEVAFSSIDEHGRRFVVMTKIHEECTYAIALHELGHLARARQPGEVALNVMVCSKSVNGMLMMLAEEKAAWAWAETHALMWSPPMDAVKEYALQTYVDLLQELRVKECR